MPPLLEIEIFGHMDAGDRRLWTRDQDERPLSDLGWRQARQMCAELATRKVDALFSSRAMRARQSLQPLAEGCGLPVTIIDGLHETDDWLPPPAWRYGRFPSNDPLGGAYAAGLAWRA